MVFSKVCVSVLEAKFLPHTLLRRRTDQHAQEGLTLSPTKRLEGVTETTGDRVPNPVMH